MVSDREQEQPWCHSLWRAIFETREKGFCALLTDKATASNSSLWLDRYSVMCASISTAILSEWWQDEKERKSKKTSRKRGTRISSRCHFWCSWFSWIWDNPMTTWPKDYFGSRTKNKVLTLLLKKALFFAWTPADVDDCDVKGCLALLFCPYIPRWQSDETRLEWNSCLSGYILSLPPLDVFLTEPEGKLCPIKNKSRKCSIFVSSSSFDKLMPQ